MNFQYLLLGIGFIVAGIACSLIFFNTFMQDMKIRKSSVKITGKILGIKNRYRFTFIPIFKSDEVKNHLTSMRTITTIKVKSIEHKTMVLFYNADYPKSCTYGSKASVLIEFLLIQSIALFMILLGIKSILLFIE